MTAQTVTINNEEIEMTVCRSERLGPWGVTPNGDIYQHDDVRGWHQQFDPLSVPLSVVELGAKRNGLLR